VIDDAKTSPPSAAQPAAVPVLSYATPDAFQTEIRRDGRYLVLPRGRELPDKCVMCGKPSDVHVEVKFDIGFPIKAMRFRVGMCRHHARQQRNSARKCRLLCGLLTAAPFAAWLLQWLVAPHTWWFDPDGMLVLGFFAFFFPGTLIFASYQPLYCQKSTATAIWIGGVGEPFLEGLSPVEPTTKSIFNRNISELL